MRSVLPALLVLACPLFMCVVPMLLARRRGEQAGCAMGHGTRDGGASEGSEETEIQRFI